MRIAQIQKDADRLRERGSEQMREHEILCKTTLGALELGLGRNEPIDEFDEPIPERHFTLPRTSVWSEVSRLPLKIGLARLFAD